MILGGISEDIYTFHQSKKLFSTFWRIVSPLVVGCQLSLQTEQMSFNRPSFLQTETHKKT